MRFAYDPAKGLPFGKALALPRRARIHLVLGMGEQSRDRGLSQQRRPQGDRAAHARTERGEGGGQALRPGAIGPKRGTVPDSTRSRQNSPKARPPSTRKCRRSTFRTRTCMPSLPISMLLKLGNEIGGSLSAALVLPIRSTPMTIRDILFPMLSYPTATAADSIERAVTWATALGAHIMGVTFELDIRSPIGLYAHPVHISGIFAAEHRKSASNARDLVAAFEDICARQGTARAGATHEHAVEHCSPTEVAAI